MTQAVEDVEIIAATVRYARAAAPTGTAKEILANVIGDFPEIDLDRIKRCMAKAARKLLEQHG